MYLEGESEDSTYKTYLISNIMQANCVGETIAGEGFTQVLLFAGSCTLDFDATSGAVAVIIRFMTTSWRSDGLSLILEVAHYLTMTFTFQFWLEFLKFVRE